MKKKQTVIATVMIIVLLVAVFGAKRLISKINASHRQLLAEKIPAIDLAKIKDGTYTGSYRTFLVAAEVKVTVKDHRITGIELLKHENGRGAAAERIPSKVIEAQSLVVDTVAGATISSKVILKAIENALTGS